MAEVLVLVEQAEGDLKKVTLELLTIARRLGEPSAVLVGDPSDLLLSSLAAGGAEKVYVASAGELRDYVTAPTVAVLQAAVEQSSPAAVLIASSADGKEIAGRLALRIGSGLITDAVGLGDDLRTQQSVFGGSTTVTAKVTTGVPVIAVRPNAAAPDPVPGAGTRVDLSVTLSESDKAARILERVVEERAGRPELTEASIVVSGGRGVGSPEGFAVVEALADSLGAAVGASRAATDAGWYPHQFQVGQTGKTVSPQLYMANGISGAIQHRAGMQTSKTIVAVNKDAEAPIFDLVDFGVIGDLHQVLPQLTDEVKRRKG